MGRRKKTLMPKLIYPALDPAIEALNRKILYQPLGEALEYAPLATSPYLGCGHRCRYCFVPHVRHITRAEFDSGAVPSVDYLKKLARDLRAYREAGITDLQVLLSSMTDCYSPFDRSLTAPRSLR